MWEQAGGGSEEGHKQGWGRKLGGMYAGVEEGVNRDVYRVEGGSEEVGRE